MHHHRPFSLIALLLALLFSTSLFARGQVWNFLGFTRFDRYQDHCKIQITRSDRQFRTMQLRFAGDAVFFDRFVVQFGNGSSEEFVVSGRISPEGKQYVVEFPDNGTALESVEFWYFKEPWDHNPSVSLYGSRWPDSAESPILAETQQNY